MKPILDATAGNRLMWKGRNPKIPYIVFLDKESKLKTSPDIIADHRYCPFRDESFSLIIYDPPFMARQNPPQIWNDPAQTQYINNRKFIANNEYWGIPKNKSELWGTIHKAQQEFQRLTQILIVKWNTMDYSIWQLLPFFKQWQLIKQQGYKRSRHPTKGYAWKLKASQDKNSKTWWLLFHFYGGKTE